MAPRTTRIAEGLLSIERDGQTFLGIETGIASNSPSLRRLAGQKRQPGLLVGHGSIEEWRPVGFAEHEGMVYLYGPLSAGRFVGSMLEDTSLDRLTVVTRMAVTYRELQKAGVSIEPIHTRSIMLLEDGRSLVLPPDIIQAIREHQDYEGRMRTMERFSHPDRSPNDNVGYYIAAACYFVLTGRHPYDGRDEEELHARVRAANPVPARYVESSIRQDISEALHAELSSAKVEPDAAVWVERLNRWKTEGFTVELSPLEREQVEREAVAATVRIERRFHRKEFIRKRGRTILIAAAVTIALGSIPFTIIQNALKPRATAGFEPEEVVRAFYTSINTLDHMTMEDAVVDGAGRDLVNEVMNIFVLDRQRMSVEFQSGYVDAQQWRDDGMPLLTGARSPYGVVDLSLEPQPSGPEERRFLVTYERWYPEYDDSDFTEISFDVGPRYAGFDVTDDVYLRLDRDDWVIYRIDRLSIDRIDIAALRAR